MSDEQKPPVPSQEQLLAYLIHQHQELHLRMDGHARALKSIHERLPTPPKPKRWFMRVMDGLLEWRAAITAVVTLVAAVIQSRRK